ncbi:vWA domain-containing protein [Pontibacter chinhatensis]|uniref:Ca-activated chloride channel family protein n=1 Tax=Pontibacter chinhatensis TaxID=1436961 RepID=A0A1I2QPN9_9BACT|nr:VWA domain-containing protein [Pontibacter chinhatensis]SFG30402.1 Ca-activated chloride channel family protein [Pontibacter chinhatensis]
MLRWSKSIATLLFLLMLSATGGAFAQEKKPQPKTRILFLLDASGSMMAKWENSDRMTVAKNLLSHLVDSLDQYDNVEVALRAYGHQFGRERNDCKDTKLEVPFGEDNATAIKKKLDAIVPRGNTPITYSLQQAAGDFPEDRSRNVVILITDGLESCGGDPCATSEALQKKRIFLRPFVIGIGIEPQQEQQLDCIGQYFNAADIKTFERVLSEIVTQTLSQTTVSVELLDEQNRPRETGVNMTFVNAMTGEAEYDYVHYLDANGKTDVLDVDALLPYHLVVYTTPPVVESNLKMQPGKNNVIRVKAPQGELYLRQDGPSPYRLLNTIVRQAGTDKTLHVQSFGERHRYLTGKYDLEILTVPRIMLRNVEVKQGETNTITIPPPGQLAIPSQVQGYGSVYELHESGAQRWVCNLPEDNSKVTLPLQPGKYKLVYRMKSAQSSKFTFVQDFTIRSGATTTVRIFNR